MKKVYCAWVVVISVIMFMQTDKVIGQQPLKRIGPKESRHSWQAMYQPGEEEPDYSMSPLTIKVTPGKNEYMWGEPVFIKIALTNDAPSTLALYVSNIEDCWLVTYIEDTHGNIINYGYYNYSAFPVRKKLVLQSGESFYTWRYLGVGRIKNRDYKTIFDKPGPYTIWAEYYSSEFRRLVIPSPKVQVTVTPLSKHEEVSFKLFFGLDHIPDDLLLREEKRESLMELAKIHTLFDNFATWGSLFMEGNTVSRLKNLLINYPESAFAKYARLLINLNILNHNNIIKVGRENVMRAIETINLLRDEPEFEPIEDLLVKAMHDGKKFLRDKEAANSLWEGFLKEEPWAFSRIKKDNAKFIDIKLKYK